MKEHCNMKGILHKYLKYADSLPYPAEGGCRYAFLMTTSLICTCYTE